MAQQGKPLSQFNDAQKKELMDDIAKVYEKHGHPSWLKAPKYFLECVNILNAGQQQVQEVLNILGKASLD